MPEAQGEQPSMRTALGRREYCKASGDKLKGSDARSLRDEYQSQEPKGTLASSPAPSESLETKQLAPIAGPKARVSSKQALIELSKGFDSLATRKAHVTSMLEVLELCKKLGLLKGNSGPIAALARAKFTVEGFGWRADRLFDSEMDPSVVDGSDVRFQTRTVDDAWARLILRRDEFKPVFERYDKHGRKQRTNLKKKKTASDRKGGRIGG